MSFGRDGGEATWFMLIVNALFKFEQFDSCSNETMKQDSRNHSSFIHFLGSNTRELQLCWIVLIESAWFLCFYVYLLQNSDILMLEHKFHEFNSFSLSWLADIDAPATRLISRFFVFLLLSSVNFFDKFFHCSTEIILILTSTLSLQLKFMHLVAAKMWNVSETWNLDLYMCCCK